MLIIVKKNILYEQKNYWGYSNLKINIFFKMSIGYIYLIHPKEYIESKEDIYKIGRTKKTLNKRLKGYKVFRRMYRYK
jgi:hypothetical protein